MSALDGNGEVYLNAILVSSDLSTSEVALQLPSTKTVYAYREMELKTDQGRLIALYAEIRVDAGESETQRAHNHAPALDLPNADAMRCEPGGQ